MADDGRQSQMVSRIGVSLPHALLDQLAECRHRLGNDVMAQDQVL
jgi:transcriptional regulator of met regulon